MASSDVFPAGFLWGAATSAYQIEGSPTADGAGESNWHRFSHTPGKVAGGDTGDLACDHYRRWEEDLALMRELELRSYRFSLAWGRLLPSGRGRVNRKGVDFYARLIDRLLEAGITPMVTLHHWDLPLALEEIGGWAHPDLPRWFADYAEVAFGAYADRVPLWCTINEPFMITDGGYVQGFHAPGRHDLAGAARASIHLQRAHALAVRVYRALGGGRGQIGLVVNLEAKQPASSAADDVAAAERAEAYMNRQYLDPVRLGIEPAELPEMFGRAWPSRSEAELSEVREPGDFVGVNYYSRSEVVNDPGGSPPRARAVREDGVERTEMGWEIHPDGLREILVWVKDRYGNPPIYVTENGSAFRDRAPGVGEIVEDPQRTDYLRRHVQAARAALREGVDLRGYYAWSLLDNFEWQYGYSKRFGLVRVDFRTQERTIKRSGLFYRDVIRTNGAVS